MSGNKSDLKANLKPDRSSGERCKKKYRNYFLFDGKITFGFGERKDEIEKVKEKEKRRVSWKRIKKKIEISHSLQKNHHIDTAKT